MRLFIGVSLGLILCGCAMFSSSIQESKTDTILKNYVSTLTYDGDRRTLARYIAQDIVRAYEWHEKKDPLIQLDRAMSGMRQVEIFGNSADVKELRDVFNRSFKISTRFPEDQDSTHRKGGPVEFSSMRAIYILMPNHQIYILNSGDRTRLYHRELELYEQAYPKKAEALKAVIIKDHPGIDFHPWED